MVPNQILQRVARGEKALGLHLTEPSGLLVELAGRCGLDFVNFDAQHSPVTPAEIGQSCQADDRRAAAEARPAEQARLVA